MKLTYESPEMTYVEESDIIETNAPVVVGIVVVVVGVVIPTVASGQPSESRIKLNLVAF